MVVYAATAFVLELDLVGDLLIERHVLIFDQLPTGRRYGAAFSGPADFNDVVFRLPSASISKMAIARGSTT